MRSLSGSATGQPHWKQKLARSGKLCEQLRQITGVEPTRTGCDSPHQQQKRSARRTALEQLEHSGLEIGLASGLFAMETFAPLTSEE